MQPWKKPPEGYETSADISRRHPTLSPLRVNKLLWATEHPHIPRSQTTPIYWKTEGADKAIRVALRNCERERHRQKRDGVVHQEEVIELVRVKKPVDERYPFTAKSREIFNNSGPYSQKDIGCLLLLFAEAYREVADQEQLNHCFTLLRDVLVAKLVIGLNIEKR